MVKKSMKAGSSWMIPVSSLQSSTPAPAVAPAVAPAPPSGPYPTGPPPAAMGMTGGLDSVSATILSLNSNPYLIGMFMILLNLGGRFLSLELTKKQEAALQSPYLRPLIFFIVIFVATRNLVAAFWVTLLFFFVIWVAANEHSPFCLIPSWCDSESASVEEETYKQNVEALTTAK